LEGYKLKEYAAIWVEGVLVNPLSLTLLAWYYMIFDKQEIIVSATSDPIVEAWDKVVDTIKAIEKYRGLSNTRW
jgi:hypothetical protein